MQLYTALLHAQGAVNDKQSSFRLQIYKRTTLHATKNHSTHTQERIWAGLGRGHTVIIHYRYITYCIYSFYYLGKPQYSQVHSSLETGLSDFAESLVSRSIGKRLFCGWWTVGGSTQTGGARLGSQVCLTQFQTISLHTQWLGISKCELFGRWREHPLTDLFLPYPLDRKGCLTRSDLPLLSPQADLANHFVTQRDFKTSKMDARYTVTLSDSVSSCSVHTIGEFEDFQ